jgi:hypothetical protein
MIRDPVRFDWLKMSLIFEKPAFSSQRLAAPDQGTVAQSGRQSLLHVPRARKVYLQESDTNVVKSVARLNRVLGECGPISMTTKGSWSFLCPWSLHATRCLSFLQPTASKFRPGAGCAAGFQEAPQLNKPLTASQATSRVSLEEVTEQARASKGRG